MASKKTKEASARTQRFPPGKLPFKPGDKLLIRTVTMIDVGVLASIGDDFFVLTDACWIADTERYEVMLATGAVREAEKFPTAWVLVGRGAVIDIAPWNHSIPGTR